MFKLFVVNSYIWLSLGSFCAYMTQVAGLLFVTTFIRSFNFSKLMTSSLHSLAVRILLIWKQLGLLVRHLYGLQHIFWSWRTVPHRPVSEICCNFLVSNCCTKTSCARCLRQFSYTRVTLFTHSCHGFAYRLPLVADRWLDHLLVWFSHLVRLY